MSGVRSVAAVAASAGAYTLAEGPLWDDAAGRVRWVDIPAGAVYEGELLADRVEVRGAHRLGRSVGAVVPTGDGGLLVAAGAGFATIAPDGEVAYGPPVLATDSRLNDGACDPAGRFLAGSLALDGRTGGEALYRLDPDGGVEVVGTGLTLSNGLGWSPDGGTLYHVDSVPGVVWSMPYDVHTGRPGPRRVVLQDAGTPDGLCVDADGNLWVAFWGAGEVRCHTPSGRHVATVRVPAPHTSSVAFVGPARDRLLITTAREQLTPAQLARYPDSGRLFLADVGVAGPPTPVWRGSAAAPPWRGSPAAPPSSLP